MIALVVNEMRKLGKIKSIPLQEQLDLLALLNETIGGAAGSSEKENLLHRIYTKWKDALPNLEEAPLFKVLGKKKEEGDGAIGKIYSFTDAEKDEWANLFEYMGSNENVRLKFAIDKIGVNLDETSIIFGDSRNAEAWDQFIASLKKEEEEEEKEESAPVEETAAPMPDKPSIAVLPFVNMSEDPKQEFFCDGMTEAIISALSKAQDLFVIARNSTFIYKGKPVKVKQVAEDLGVQYVMEGSVQLEGDRVRITVQLIDAITGHHLFSERYDRGLQGILNLQDEITMKVLNLVQVTLIMGENARLRAIGTKNLDAYLKVMQAYDHKGGAMNKERTQRAMQLFEEAIALDPGYAIAYSLLCTAHFEMVLLGATDSPRESLQRALELGKKGIALDDSHSGVHACLVYPYTMLGEYDKAISEGEKAVSLGPNSAGAYFALGAALYYAGRPQEAVPMIQKCLGLSPIPVHSEVLGVLARSYRDLGQYEEAVATYKKMFHRYGPDNLLAHLELAVTYALMDREKDARAEGAEVLRIDPKFSIDRYMNGMPGDQSVKDRRIELLRKAGLK